MKLLQQFLGWLQGFLAKSLVWSLIAFLACIPLGILLLNIFDRHIENNEAFMEEIDGRIDLLFLIFAFTCFTGVILIRLLATSIKLLADKKNKPSKS